MLHSHLRMPLAFFGTDRTDPGAQLADTFYVLSIEQHDLRRGPADSGTLDIQPDTGPQTGDIRFFQTGIGALVTHSGAINTGVDTALIFCVWHKKDFRIHFE